MPLVSHQLFSFGVSGVICLYYYTICTIKSLAYSKEFIPPDLAYTTGSKPSWTHRSQPKETWSSLPTVVDSP